MTSESSVHKSAVISSDTLAVEFLCQQLLGEVAARDFGAEDIFGIHLGFEEAFINAIKHGNKEDKNKQISIEYLITDDRFEITITDEGEGFNPESVPDPRSEENLYKISGRGMFLMRSYMDIVEYNKKGNSVRMVKNKTMERNG